MHLGIESKLLGFFSHSQYRQMDECWIVDDSTEGENLGLLTASWCRSLTTD